MKKKFIVLKLGTLSLLIFLNIIYMVGAIEINIRNIEVAYTSGDSFVKSKDNSVYEIAIGAAGRLYIPGFSETI